MAQERLFRLAVEAVTAQLRYVPGHGWRVHLAARRGDEDWSVAATWDYDHLSTEEAYDALCESLARAFGV